MPFLFSFLPLELACEIIRLTTTIGTISNSHSRNHVYGTGCSLALVSTTLRHLTMPFILHTVILPTQETINLFLRTLQDQTHSSTTGSRLKLDYKVLVRRIWSSQCWEPFAEQPRSYFHNYQLFYDIFSNAQNLGFDFRSTHLLYEALGGVRSNHLPNWKCTRVTFAGELPRWNSLASTNSGLAFLRCITHLTIWAPWGDISGSTSTGVPSWLSMVPFKLMPNLTHFAFTLATGAGAANIPVLTFTLPPSSSTLQGGEGGAAIFQAWATSHDPISYGSLRNLDVGQPVIGPIPSTSWEMAFYSGQNDEWPRLNYGQQL